MKSKSNVLLSLPDFLLTATASVCLVVVVLQGFVVDASLQFNLPLNAALCVALQLVLFATAQRLFSPAIGIAVYVALCALLLGMGLATSTVSVQVDEEGNHFIYALAVVLVNTCLYLLSRTKARFAVLWVASIFAVTFVQLLYHADLYVPSILFLVCIVSLFVYRSYCASVQASDVTGHAAYGSSLLATGGVVIAGLAATLLVFFCVVAPLNPGRVSVKLFTVDEALETVEVNNPVVVVKVEDEEQLTETLSDEEIFGNQSREVDGMDVSSGGASDFMEDSIEYAGSAMSYSVDGLETADLDLVTLELPDRWWLLIPVGVALLVIVAIVARKHMRRRHCAKLKLLSGRGQVAALYTELLRKLEKLGLGKATTQTPVEFARDAVERLASFGSADADVTWAAVSLAYDASHYGGKDPTPQQLQACWQFYDGIAANALHFVGRRRYCMRFFWTL